MSSLSFVFRLPRAAALLSEHGFITRSYFIKFVPAAADPRPDKLLFRNLFRYEREILRKHRGIIKQQFKKLMRRRGRDVVSAYSLLRVIFHCESVARESECPRRSSRTIWRREAQQTSSALISLINGENLRLFALAPFYSRALLLNARFFFLHRVLPRSSIFLNFFQVRQRKKLGINCGIETWKKKNK